MPVPSPEFEHLRDIRVLGHYEFDCSFHSMIFDLGSDRLRYEKP